LSIYIENGFEIDCRFSWNEQPQNKNDCFMCMENDWCPLSLYNNEIDNLNEHRKKQKKIV
jgi:hypothetical protein